MESDRITIRLPRPLRLACEHAAAEAGQDLGKWLRTLAAKATGVSGDIKLGLAGASKKARKAASRAGHKARWNKPSSSMKAQ